jgi:hypothetical protein
MIYKANMRYRVKSVAARVAATGLRQRPETVVAQRSPWFLLPLLPLLSELLKYKIMLRKTLFHNNIIVNT